ncbi:MAG: glycosyltransferase family 4 protein [Bryobacteraceae bacterium]|jgi:glycosyltransferase involved in cell wall biosynthesis
MNILFLDQFSAVGGGQRSLLELLPLLHARGWGARVALPGGGPYAEKVRASGFPVEPIPCGEYANGRKGFAEAARFGASIPSMMRAIARLAHERRIGLLYVNGPRLLPAAAWVARTRSIPLIFHCHHRILQPIAARLAGEALRWSSASMIASCRFAAEPLAPYLPAERSRVIYNGVSEPAWTRRPRDPSKPWNIGVVGGIGPEKGQMEFVAAARILSSEITNCRFVIAGAPLSSGPEYLEEIKSASRDLPFQFLGWQEDIGDVFSQLDLLVVPSTHIDSTPRVVVEAFSGGLPVVAFPSGGIPEIVEDGRTGFLATANTPAALAARIRSVLSMRLRPLREIAKQAQAVCREKYALDRFQKEVGDVIAQAFSRTSVRNRNADAIATQPDATRTGG